MADSTLNGVLMKALEDILQLRPKTQPVMAIQRCGMEVPVARRRVKAPVHWAELQVFPVLMLHLRLQPIYQRTQVLRRLNQWLAMFREGQRDHPQAREPAMDPTKYHAVLQFLTGPRRRESNGSISVRPAKSS